MVSRPGGDHVIRVGFFSSRRPHVQLVPSWKGSEFLSTITNNNLTR